jgi:hypothetical protein
LTADWFFRFFSAPALGPLRERSKSCRGSTCALARGFLPGEWGVHGYVRVRVVLHPHYSIHMARSQVHLT